MPGGDSNLYVRRRKDSIVLTIEHRAAASPPPVTLALVDDDGPVRLEIRETKERSEPQALPERILHTLAEAEPLNKHDLRPRLRVRNHDLAEALRDLEEAGQITKTPAGWVRSRSPTP